MAPREEGRSGVRAAAGLRVSEEEDRRDERGAAGGGREGLGTPGAVGEGPLEREREGRGRGLGAGCAREAV